MDVVAGAVGERFLDEVAAVGSRIDGDVLRPSADAALKDGFQGGKVVVVGGEAQIVNEQDELERICRQLVHQVRDLIELILLDLHQTQAVGGKLVRNGLDRAGFAGAGVAVEQDIVCRHPGQQCARVGDDLFPFFLVARQLAEPLRVRILDRHQMAVLNGEDVVLCKHAIAFFADFAHPLGISVRQVDFRCFPTGQEGQLRTLRLLRIRSLEQFIQRQTAQFLQKAQLVVQRALQHRRQLPCRRLTDADGLGLEDSRRQILAEVGGMLEQSGFKCGHCVADRSHAPAPGLHPVSQVDQFCHHRVIQQCAEDHKPMQMGVPFSEFHNAPLFIPSYFDKYMVFKSIPLRLLGRKGVQLSSSFRRFTLQIVD